MGRSNYTSISIPAMSALLLLSSSLTPVSVLAQTAPAAASATPDQAAAPATEADIVVTGIRASLESAANIKRNATSIVDAISAEDIGSFPDQNIAESLQRITGVQITRSRGEGRDVSIRGLEPKFANVTLNGDSVASVSASNINATGTTGLSRSFDFTILSSDFVTALEVYKAPTSDLDEGGLAGTVNVRTIRPLDLKERKLTFNVEGIKNSYVGKLGAHATGIYADQFFDDRLGIMLGADYSKRQVETQSYQGGGMERKIESAYSPNNLTRGYVDYNFDGDLNDAYRESHVQQYQQDEGTRERRSFIGTIQFKATDALELRLSGLHSTFTSDIASYAQTAQWHLTSDPNIRGNLVVADNISAIRPTADDVSNDANRTPIAGILDYQDRNGVWLDQISKFAQEKSKFYNITGGATYTGAQVVIDAQASFNKTSKTSSNYGFDVQRWGSVAQDFRQDPDGIPSFTYLRGTDPLDPKGWFLPSNAFVGTAFNTPQTNKNNLFSLNLTWKPDTVSWLTQIKAGAKYSTNDVFQGDSRITVSAEKFASLTGDTVLTNCSNCGTTGIAAAPYLTTFGGSDFLSRYNGPSTFPRTWLGADLRGFLDKYSIDQVAGLPGVLSSNLPSIYSVSEKVFAGYVRADFTFLEDRLTGNVGVRLVSTKQSSTGNAIDLSRLIRVGTVIQTSSLGPVTAKHNYVEPLPSLNLSYKIDDSKIIRFGASRTLTRPDLTAIAPSATISYVARTLSVTNPNLDPYTANNLDLSFEWYTGRSSIVSAALFYKRIKGYTATSVDSVNLPVINSVGNAVENIDFARTSRVNGSPTTIKGAEINIQQSFTFLPAPFDGLGAIANYTYTKAGTITLSQGGLPLPLTGVSKNSFNLVGYYEKGPISFRVAYNYRSQYVEDALASRLDGNYVKAFGQIDASARLKATDWLSFSIDGSNLTDTPLIHVNKYGFSRGWEVNGRTITFGARASF